MTNRTMWVCVIALHGCWAGAALAIVPPLAFSPIPGLPGDNPNASNVLGVSGDGGVAYGEVRTTGRWEAMRWTATTGTAALGEGWASGASHDGSILVGSRGRWTSATGWQALTAPAGTTNPLPSGISADGSTMVGSARQAGNNVGVRWTAPGPGTILPPVPGEPLGFTADHATSDGSLIFGNRQSGGAWATDGVTSWAINGVSATDVSPDGQWMVSSLGLATAAGVRLNVTTGVFTTIPNMPGRQGGAARGVSADGSLVVGWGGTSRRAFLWDAQNGTRDLNVLLPAWGINLQGWILLEARGISDDGRTIVGLGVNPQGFDQSWIVTIPAPGAAGLAAMVLGLALRRRR